MSEKPVKSNELPTDEHVWLGDLTGFEVFIYHDRHWISHRCGWDDELPNTEFLANIVVKAMEEHRDKGCNDPRKDFLT